MKNRKTYLIYGVSKGLGYAITNYVPAAGDFVYGVSRTQPVLLKDSSDFCWIKADLSNPDRAQSIVKDVVADHCVDYLIYNVGIWEEEAFSTKYSFEKSPHLEIDRIIQTNITSCIYAIQAMLPNLRQSVNAKVILIGSTWGLDNHNGKEVAFSASKFALRGIVHALRETLRKDSIGISILNFGYLATEYGYEEEVQHILSETEGALIPLQDALQAIRFILSTSRGSCVKEIDMPAMKDQNV